MLNELGARSNISRKKRNESSFEHFEKETREDSDSLQTLAQFSSFTARKTLLLSFKVPGEVLVSTKFYGTREGIIISIESVIESSHSLSVRHPRSLCRSKLLSASMSPRVSRLVSPSHHNFPSYRNRICVDRCRDSEDTRVIDIHRNARILSQSRTAVRTSEAVSAIFGLKLIMY